MDLLIDARVDLHIAWVRDSGDALETVRSSVAYAMDAVAA
jgi:hypothetical protein